MKWKNDVIINTKNKYGYNSYTKEDDKYSLFLDVGILKLKQGDKYYFKSEVKEKAILIWSGKVEIISKNYSKIILHRQDFWKDFLMVIHGSKDEEFTILALEESEMVLQAKTNANSFATKVYDKQNCKVSISGNNYKPSTSTRYIIDVFNYENAPYSNMVLGEVFSMPGHWSSYPPHKHNQPEMYIYRYDKSQGYGVALLDDDPFVVQERDGLIIPTQTMHGNACAPGYQMYFVWMISHLTNDPWAKREFNKKHEWINEKNLQIKIRSKIIKEYEKN